MCEKPNYDLTFIVPVYNVEDYLAECLDSLVKQSVNKEIIIINDGSTDTSDLIIQQYFRRYPFITVINQYNKGLSEARNQGIKLAKGEFIYFVDSDDYVMETEFASIICIAREHNIDFLKGQIQRHYTDGRIVKRPPEHDDVKGNNAKVICGEYFLNCMLTKDWHPGAWYGLYRTAFLRKYDISFPIGLKAEDVLFNVDTLLAYSEMRVMEMDRLFYNYRQRENSIIYNIKDNSLLCDIFKICELLKIRQLSFIKLKTEKLENEKVTKFSIEQLDRIIINLERIRAIQYMTAYLYQYQKYSDELKEKSKPLFTPEIIALVNKLCPIKITL